MTGPRNATTTGAGRTYRWHNRTRGVDEVFDSVTTIIGGGAPKPALKPWAEKLVATTAVDKHAIWADMTRDEAIDWLKRSPFRETDRAAAQGTDVHNWAEAHVLGQPVTVEGAPEAQRGYLMGFLQFIAEMRPTWEMSEASVFNRTHGYAGTLDALMVLGDDVASRFGMEGLGLVDYKTNRSGIFPEVALQLAAYAHAEFVGLPDGTEIPMPDVQWCAALHLTPTGYHLVPVDAGPLAFEYFLNVKAVRDYVTTVGKGLIGHEVRLPPVKGRHGMQADGVTPADANVAALVD